MSHTSIYAVLSFSVLLLSCAKPVIFSGGDLPADQRASFGASSRITIHRIDGIDVDGRIFILAPGSYSIEFSSARDQGEAGTYFKGAINIVDCRADVTLAPGEELIVSSRLRSKSRLGVSIDHSINFTSSRDDAAQTPPLVSCEQTVDYSGADQR